MAEIRSQCLGERREWVLAVRPGDSAGFQPTIDIT